MEFRSGTIISATWHGLVTLGLLLIALDAALNRLDVFDRIAIPLIVVVAWIFVTAGKVLESMRKKP